LKGLREAVIVEAVRTPAGKSAWKEKKGAFCDTSAHLLIHAAITALVERVKEKCSRFDPVEIEDCAVGCHSQLGDQALIGRMAVLIAGLPEEVAGATVTRYGSDGLQAINSQAQAIMTGCGDIMIAAGLEHMSRYPLLAPLEAALKSGYPMSAHPNFERRGGYVMPGTAAEMIGERYNLHREDMDRFSLWSHQKAVRAMREEEWYKKRIVPVKVEVDGQPTRIVDKDETPRAIALDDPEAAWKQMQQLQPRFKEGGQVTAGNSSAIADGAAAIMLMSKKKAKELGLEPMVTIRAMAVAGGDPFTHFLAPISAIKKALARAGLTMDDIEVWECLEGFASAVLAYCKEFGVAYDDPRINPTGGSIAIGNPIGCSGALYFTEMVHWMVRHNLRWGLVSISGVHGVGTATIVERER